MAQIKYKTQGICSREITFSIEDGRIKDVVFRSGCNGNLQGISRLVEGMPAKEVIKRLWGIDCEGRGTSCPDQLAKAIESAIKLSDKGDVSTNAVKY